MESYDAETGRMAMFALLISDLQEPKMQTRCKTSIAFSSAEVSGVSGFRLERVKS